MKYGLQASIDQNYIQDVLFSITNYRHFEDKTDTDY